jgi:4-amino-4-deoxy-L-arabinose transferase-like glycosyltransferase
VGEVTPRDGVVKSKWVQIVFAAVSLSFLVLFPLAFVNRGIYIDEAWIGEQVKALLDHGTIVTNLFRDYPPLDQQIVIYHKLLVWLGVASSDILGWGLYSLRLVSAVAGFLTLLICYFHLCATESRRIAAIGAILLLCTPLFWEMMRIYRPEMLVTCLGFAGYVVLYHARARSNIWLLLAAGLLSGLSGTAHPAGMAFAAAGFIALLLDGQLRYAFIFAIAALLGFAPYLSGFVTDNALAMRQIFHNDTMSAMVRYPWWSPIVNLLEEHKRIFRQPMVIGISVMFFLSLFFTRRSEFKQRKFFWIYLTTLFLCGAMLPFPKITRYMLPLAPFFSIACARIIDGIIAGTVCYRRALRVIFVAWIAIFLCYNAYALAFAALIDKQAPQEIRTHRTFAENMAKGTLVMAPPKFIFPEIDSFTIQSYWGAHATAGPTRTCQFLEDYAAKLGVKYLIIDREVMRDWHFDMHDGGAGFKKYHPLKMLPEHDCYLLANESL